MKDKVREKAILVGVSLNRVMDDTKNNLIELARLACTAGAEVVHEIYQTRNAPDPKYYIGKGKAEQLKTFSEELDVKLIIFDDELTPAQTKNLQNLLEIKVIDRAALILDIFTKHAKTREAKTQIELAQLQYILPRLSRMWKHLERQMGGIGTRGGPGETQIEIDRRLIRDKISKLKKDLKKIENQRQIRQLGRSNTFLVVLAGYTNAGKSTLMHALTGADVLIQNQLFATLDTTTRVIPELADQQVLLTDTVGFIKKLPHHLVASFRSTLEIVHDADLILKVADISDPAYPKQLETVNQVLNDLDAGAIPSQIILNKVDMLKDDTKITEAKNLYDESIIISAAQNIRTNEVIDVIKSVHDSQLQTQSVKLPASDGKTIASIYSHAEVISEKYDNLFVEIQFRSSRAFAEKIKQTAGEEPCL